MKFDINKIDIVTTFVSNLKVFGFDQFCICRLVKLLLVDKHIWSWIPRNVMGWIDAFWRWLMVWHLCFKLGLILAPFLCICMFYESHLFFKLLDLHGCVLFFVLCMNALYFSLLSQKELMPSQPCFCCMIIIGLMINKLHFLVVPHILLVLKNWGMHVIVD